MYDFFADSSAIGEKEIIIRGSDLNHMKNVLRLQIGEQICIHEESTGKEYRCEIAGYEKDVAQLHICGWKRQTVSCHRKFICSRGCQRAIKWN